jgi:putative ATP-binding cassette transporter
MVQQSLSQRHFHAAALRFWRGPSARLAWALSLGLLVFIGCQIAVQLLWTHWNGWFTDALQQRDRQAMVATLPWLLLIVPGFMVVLAVMTGLRMTLQTRWRAHLTHITTSSWLADHSHYRLSLDRSETLNPEHRIVDDVRLSTETGVDLAVGVITAGVGALAFSQILWAKGGVLRIDQAGWNVVIPGFMVGASLLYGVGMNGVVALLGRGLAQALAMRNAAEAQSRAALGRIGEYGESIAFSRGEAGEAEAMRSRFGLLFSRWQSVIRRNVSISCGTSAGVAISPLVPLLCATPKYLAGEIAMGDIVQLAGAFAATQIAIAWFAENFPKIAEWRAACGRVGGLLAAMEASGRPEPALCVEHAADHSLTVRDLSLSLPNGRRLLENFYFTAQPRERVLIGGPSGTGKTTLIRALAGLWPWASGTLVCPRPEHVMFLPQGSYMPNGKLRAAICYGVACDPDDCTIADALRRCALPDLAGRLDEEARWDQILSVGERQRVAFARVLLARPSLIIMDEATSALDTPTEALLMRLLESQLPGATVISIGHRETLVALHDRVVTLGPSVAIVVAPHLPVERALPRSQPRLSQRRRRSDATRHPVARDRQPGR